MKKIFATMALLLTMVLPAQAADFKEGKHYDVIASQASASPVVAEYFSYFCPHCYSFEPIVKDVKANLPKDVKFNKVHVPFIGGPMGEEMQRAYATAAMLKVEPEVSAALFSAIHDKKVNFKSREHIRDVFVMQGVDGAKFDQAVESFAVNGMVAKMSKATDKAKIRGVPAIVVNDKFLINTGSLSSVEELNELIAHLTKMK